MSVRVRPPAPRSTLLAGPFSPHLLLIPTDEAHCADCHQPILRAVIRKISTSEPSRRNALPSRKQLRVKLSRSPNLQHATHPGFIDAQQIGTTALSFNNAAVVAGSSRSTRPCFSFAISDSGSTSESTFKPTASAVFGLTPGPTPPASCFTCVHDCLPIS